MNKHRLRIPLPFLSLVFLLAMIAGCSDCKSACRKGAQCMETTYARCVSHCEKGREKAKVLNHSDIFDQYLQCLEGLSTKNRRSCKVGYVACFRMVPSEVFVN